MKRRLFHGLFWQTQTWKREFGLHLERSWCILPSSLILSLCSLFDIWEIALHIPRNDRTTVNVWFWHKSCKRTRHPHKAPSHSTIQLAKMTKLLSAIQRDQWKKDRITIHAGLSKRWLRLCQTFQSVSGLIQKVFWLSCFVLGLEEKGPWRSEIDTSHGS